MSGIAGGLVSTGSFPKRLWPGVKLFYGDTYNKYPREYELIYQREESDKAYEEYVSQAGTPLGVLKPEGSPISIGSFRQALTTRIVNVTYGLMFAVSQEMQEDDQYTPKVAKMAIGTARCASCVSSPRCTMSSKPMKA